MAWRSGKQKDVSPPWRVSPSEKGSGALSSGEELRAGSNLMGHRTSKGHLRTNWVRKEEGRVVRGRDFKPVVWSVRDHVRHSKNDRINASRLSPPPAVACLCSVSRLPA